MGVLRHVFFINVKDHVFIFSVHVKGHHCFDKREGLFDTRCAREQKTFFVVFDTREGPYFHCLIQMNGRTFVA